VSTEQLRIVDLRHQQKGQIRITSDVGDVANVLQRNPHAARYARLFSAAPELLDALRNLLAECDRHGCFEHVSFEHPMLKPIFDAARTAIAKAEGAQP
jgi:hypothetical protein